MRGLAGLKLLFDSQLTKTRKRKHIFGRKKKPTYKMQYIKNKKQMVFVMCALLHLIVSTRGEINTNHINHHNDTFKHHRVRRIVGRRTECVPDFRRFCKKFTHGKITKRFCLVVNVNRCTALD